MKALAVLAVLVAGSVFGQSSVPLAAKYMRRDLVREARAVWGLDAPVAVLAGQIHQESGWNDAASSWVGAQGLAQFMPATAKWISEEFPELGPAAPFSYRWSMRAMIRYDDFLLVRFPRAMNECEKWGFALGSYNGGLGWMRKRVAKSPQPSKCLNATCLINPGITVENQKQNQEYSSRILLRHQHLYADALWGRSVCLKEMR